MAHETTRAYHEAGHMIASWRFGFPTDRVTIIPEGRAWGSHVGDSPAHRLGFGHKSSPKTLEAIEKLAVICYAGPAAQRCFKPQSWRHHHGEDDQKEANRLIELLITDTKEELEVKDKRVREEMLRREQGLPQSTLAQVEHDNREFQEARCRREDLKHAELRGRAEALVREHWEEVEAVAKALLEHKELSGEKATQLLETLTGETIPTADWVKEGA